MRIVVDTNVIASAIFFGGKPYQLLLSKFEIIRVSSDIQASRDPEDNKFISCAVDGKCLYIVSGDDDLLSVGNYGDV